MISKHTFSEVLDGLREHYLAGYYEDTELCDQVYSPCRGNLIDAEDTIITLLSESLCDYDDVIYDWVHGLLITDESGVAHLEIHRGSEYPRHVRIEDAGDLYDYLMFTNHPKLLAAVELDEYLDDLNDIYGGDYQ